MIPWREHLNRLAVEFWCGIGNLADLPAWAAQANAETGEVHPEVWEIYTSPTTEHATQLLLKMAQDINGFTPKSCSAEAFVIDALKKALTLFLEKKLCPRDLCALVKTLDAAFVTNTPEAGEIDAQDPAGSFSATSFADGSWLGDLWNCCDWCDDSWTFENSPHLVAEAQRVLAILSNPAQRENHDLLQHASRSTERT